jgi:hypothetical protein
MCLFRQNSVFASLHLRSPIHVVPTLMGFQCCLISWDPDFFRVRCIIVSDRILSDQIRFPGIKNLLKMSLSVYQWLYTCTLHNLPLIIYNTCNVLFCPDSVDMIGSGIGFRCGIHSGLILLEFEGLSDSPNQGSGTFMLLYGFGKIFWIKHQETDSYCEYGSAIRI